MSDVNLPPLLASRLTSWDWSLRHDWRRERRSAETTTAYCKLKWHTYLFFCFFLETIYSQEFAGTHRWMT